MSISIFQRLKNYSSLSKQMAGVVSWRKKWNYSSHMTEFKKHVLYNNSRKKETTNGRKYYHIIYIYNKG